MSEAITQRTLALAAEHQHLRASFGKRDGWMVPLSYGDLSAEYRAVRSGPAGLIDLSMRSRLLVSGSEAVQFLNGLISNDMKMLALDHWMPAVFPNVQGRLVAAVRVIHRTDGFLIDTEAVTHDATRKNVERFTLAGDFKVVDLSDQTVLISLQGVAAGDILRRALNLDALAEQFAGMESRWREGRITIIRASHTAEDGFDLFVETENAAALWRALIEAGAHPVGAEASEILRLEAGIARYGVDMDETHVVPETNLDDAVSYTKGCYLGQEIIARIKYRGHPAKKLTGLTFADRPRLERGAIIKTEDGKEIGRITSATISPQLECSIALGYVKYDYLGSGTKVIVSAEGSDAIATVSDLPFIRGSWYRTEGAAN